ncbi:flagellar hook-length control protein FliK [Thermoanaerobacter thermocopriae]|uniref:flagellar hook-length control protein FliK n=1 Tax=Thermoanaerobacter thermocopriae TaxID=29350 RepID=UPI000A8C4258|nr:flagellar hook-length control protein FliK [Thermoanaerobacter thermocopriae]
MIGVVPDTDLLPFKIQQPRVDRSKTVVSFQKDNKVNKFSKMLQQEEAINRNKEYSMNKVVSDGNAELNGLFSTTRSLKEEKNLKSFQTADLSLVDVFNLLQQLINGLNVAIQKDDGKQLIEKQDFYAELQKEVQKLMQDFLNNGVLDVDKLSQKISQLLEEKLGIKVQPDKIATAIRSSNFKEVLDLYKDENVDVKNLNTQETESFVFSQQIIKKDTMDNLTLVTSKNRNLPLNNQHISEENKENILETNDSQSGLNTKILVVKEEKNAGENKQLQPNDLTFLENNGKTFKNQLVNYQSSKLNDAPESQIFDQIVKSMNISKNHTFSTISIQLKPEFLGKLQINLKSAEGNISATIITDSEKLKHQIESNIGILNTQLDLKGIKINSFNVTVDKNLQLLLNTMANSKVTMAIHNNRISIE